MARLIRDGSLRLKAPLAIAATLLVGVGAFGALAYDAVSRSLVSAAEMRMGNAASQIVQLSAPQNAAREARARLLADDPVLRAAIRSPGSANREAVRAALRRFGADTGAQVATELRDSTGATLFTLSDRPAFGTRITTPATDSLVTGRLFVASDTIFSEVGAPILENGRVIGRVSQVRVATTGPATAERLRQLFTFSPEFAFLIGNQDGTVWTDLTGRVERPRPTAGLLQYDRGGVPRVAVHAPYPGAPLVLSVEATASALREPARRLLWAFVTIGALVVAIGAAVGWWMTSGLTGDLARLTDAAEQIAQGHLDPPDIAVERGDEIGRLGRSFTHMRDSVRQAHETLEAQVAARTEELHRAQEDLVKKERLAILGQLSSSVGHELRNPLGVMTNAVYFLEMTVGDAPAKVREYLGILRTQIRLSEKIVADLLDFARIRPPQRTRVSVAAIVTEQLGRVTMPESVRVDQSSVDPDATVFVDPVQVGQVVINLLINAVQAMEEGGTLTVRTRATASFVQLEVADTGPGIAPEHLERIFEPLFTTKARGIGLGLSVSRTLAASNGGQITATSTPGAGATFTLSLPVGVA